MHSEIKDLIPLDNTHPYFVPGAHIFNFDGEDWLSLHCPTTPPFYIFHEFISNTDMWYTRAVKYSVNDYKFNFETVTRVTTGKFLS